MTDINKEKPVFYFDVEIKKRELLSRLTLAAFLAEKGYHVFIGERSTSDSIKKYIPRAVVIRKSVKPNSVEILKDFVRNGYSVINMEEEGVLFGEVGKYLQIDMPHNTVGIPDKHFLWGGEQRKLLQKVYPNIRDRLIVLGNPRVYLWKNKYHGFYDKLAYKIKDNLGDFVLISSNFAFYTNRRHVKDMVSSSGFLNKNENESIYNEFYENSKFLFKEFVDAAKEISSKGIKVVFRPHPSESVDKIKEYFVGYDNIIVSSDYDVAPWILASRAVIHNCCSTGLEAVFMKKNTIAFTPNHISQYKLNEVDKLSKIALNLDDLLKHIFSPKEINVSKMNLDGYLYTKVSLNKIVKELESVQMKSSFNLNQSRFFNYKILISNFFYINSRKLKDFFIFSDVKKQAVKTVREKFPITKNIELTNYLTHIYNSDVLKKPVTSTVVGKNAFYIHCDSKKNTSV